MSKNRAHLAKVLTFQNAGARKVAKDLKAKLGGVFSLKTCERIVNEMIRFEHAGCSTVKILYDSSMGQYFMYDVEASDQGVESLFMALAKKYRLSTDVPNWLAKKLIFEPVELALSGYPVWQDQVDKICQMFWWQGISGESVWQLIQHTVAASEANCERIELEAEAREVGEVRRVSKRI